MDKGNDAQEDDCFYPSDFEEVLEHVVGVEEMLQNHQSNDDLDYSTTYTEAFFKLSDGETEMEDAVEHHEGMSGYYENQVNSSSNNIDICTDESFLYSLEHVPILTFPKHVHFTGASMKLMIECLQKQEYPSFDQIRAADPNFRPLAKHHGRHVDAHDVVYNIEQWKNLQASVKLIHLDDGIALFPSKHDSIGRQIPPIELWCSIVQTAHVNVEGKHLSLTATLNAIRTKWSTDIRVGGIHTLYISKCIDSCSSCEHSKLWNEVHTVSLDALDVTLDAVCAKHMVLRRLRQTRRYENHIVKYYRCHRGGNKTRPHTKNSATRVVEDKNSRLDRKSRLCNCSFQLKTIEPIIDINGGGISSGKKATIAIHSEHIGHILGSNEDLLFLPVHPLVCCMAQENLKRMISTSTIALASKRDEQKIKAMVTELERVTYRFFIIPKEVGQERHSMRVNGKYFVRLF
jgi:hypothetical protein